MAQVEKSRDRDINREKVLCECHGEGEDGPSTKSDHGHTDLQFSQGEAVPSEEDIGTGEAREEHEVVYCLPGLEPA